ncbi:hypothetical protein Hanom_Chr09g00781261 [Helianthus anomalus]
MCKYLREKILHSQTPLFYSSILQILTHLSSQSQSHHIPFIHNLSNPHFPQSFPITLCPKHPSNLTSIFIMPINKEPATPPMIGKIGPYTVFVTPPATPKPTFECSPAPVKLAPPVVPPPVQYEKSASGYGSKFDFFWDVVAKVQNEEFEIGIEVEIVDHDFFFLLLLLLLLFYKLN